MRALRATMNWQRSWEVVIDVRGFWVGHDHGAEDTEKFALVCEPTCAFSQGSGTRVSMSNPSIPSALRPLGLGHRFIQRGHQFGHAPPRSQGQSLWKRIDGLAWAWFAGRPFACGRFLSNQKRRV
ncbi:unnamed protein product [Ostreobium quekettii]|uniref:Uncharacterized protein n=1 Tax=Ostreobium quekettii TaxID=121088 RepID=A0A8S1IR16_9CHLO|nr:unnamed protein product [Ostreobium quekettii]